MNPKQRSQKLAILRQRDGHDCVWCSAKLGVRTSTLDHVVPRAQGGTHWTGNLIISCAECNHRRGDMDVLEYAQECARSGRNMRLEVLAVAVSRADDPLASNRQLYASRRQRSKGEPAYLTVAQRRRRREKSRRQRRARAERRQLAAFRAQMDDPAQWQAFLSPVAVG